MSQPDYRLIELMFFGYRDFVAEADRVLAAYGFGRAHHRVLHFVHRHPGLTVAELLQILGITKQALGRVLKELVETGLIDQQAGPNDRRQRLLKVTEKGGALAHELAAAQSRRLHRAVAAAGTEQQAAIERFLLHLVEEEHRLGVSRLTDVSP